VLKLANVSDIAYANAANTAQFRRSTPTFDVALVYEIKVDVAAERTRIEKELAQLEKELEGKRKQLCNDAFLSKAPAHVVDGLRTRAAEIETLIQKNRSALGGLQ
jgi:valyl-tRNA synthetase